MYGHSQVRDIEYVPAVPPEILYHGGQLLRFARKVLLPKIGSTFI
jgi:RNA:NAD 2'-phosphotransferase (TPT1/KptA family)